MKYLYSFILLLTVTADCFTQAPEIQWQNTIGGSAFDELTALEQTADGGYILGGYSYSEMSGDKSENSWGGDYRADYWVVKLNSAGFIEWENTIGGNDNDFLYTIHQTSDGGYILGGSSLSDISGDKTENRITPGANPDYWIVKLDASGNILWQNTIGGTNVDELYAIQETADGGFIAGGVSYSGISGDKTEASKGGGDYWVLKLNSIGEIEWQKTIGGNSNDWLFALEITNDSGFILAGWSMSDISGDKTEAPIGGPFNIDCWVIKTDATGNIIWQNTIGGTGSDILYDIKQTTDNGFILAVVSDSPASGDKTENCLGMQDYWVVKMNEEGNVEWENTIGGPKDDELHSIFQTADSGFILGGWSESDISLDKSEISFDSPDYWIVKLTNAGEIAWENTIGGENNDYLSAINITNDGGIIIGGWSGSDISGDKSENSFEGGGAQEDYWVAKLYPESCSVPSGLFANNITTTHVKLNWISEAGADKYQIYYRMVGELSWTKLSAENNFKNLSGLIPNTTYEFKVRAKCSGENTGFSEINNFTTLPLKQEDINSEIPIAIGIYPNPASNQITVRNLQSSVGDALIIITDLSGKMIFQNELTSPETIIDVSQYANGIYFVKLMVDENTVAKKIIIER